MPFEVNDYIDLVRLLGEHPEWRSELRRLLLTDELLDLPALVREMVEIQRRTEERMGRVEEQLALLAEAQRRTEERVGRVEEQLALLAEAQRRTEERVSRVEEQLALLAEAQRRTEERVSRVEEQLALLAEAQRHTEERVSRVEEQLALLAEAQRRTEERVSRVEEQLALLAEAQRRAAEQIASLAEADRRLTDVVAGIKGRLLELTYRENAGAYFGSLLRRIRVVKPHTLEDRLEAHLSREEFKDVLLLDLLVRGQLRDSIGTPEIWLAVEISAVVDRADVQRAQRRAELLRRAGLKVIPVVAGERTTEGAEEEARTHSVAVMEDGRITFWEEAVQAWTRR